MHISAWTSASGDGRSTMKTILCSGFLQNLGYWEGHGPVCAKEIYLLSPQYASARATQEESRSYDAEDRGSFIKIRADNKSKSFPSSKCYRHLQIFYCPTLSAPNWLLLMHMSWLDILDPWPSFNIIFWPTYFSFLQIPFWHFCFTFWFSFLVCDSAQTCDFGVPSLGQGEFPPVCSPADLTSDHVNLGFLSRRPVRLGSGNWS